MQGIKRQTQTRHRCGSNVVCQHVGCFAQSQQLCALRLLAQVKHNRAFVTVGIDKDMPHALVFHGTRMAHDVAAGRLYLDNVCAIVPQNLGGIRAQNDARQIDDAQSGQRAL